MRLKLQTKEYLFGKKGAWKGIAVGCVLAFLGTSFFFVKFIHDSRLVAMAYYENIKEAQAESEDSADFIREAYRDTRFWWTLQEIGFILALALETGVFMAAVMRRDAHQSAERVEEVESYSTCDT